jgi:5-methyltetrahydropteroyltriglutamate--homocysteine methyltransferase
MTQQAQDDYYHDPAAMALDYAQAVNEELRDAAAAGADIVQIDEPYLQARPDAAREFALVALNRALDGIDSETALHTCFGYAAIVKKRASGYSFLAELDACAADQICLEAAQPRLDLSILEQLPNKQIVLGVLDLGDGSAESALTVAGRIRAALRHVPPERLSVGPDCGMKYLPRELAQAKLRALVEGAQIVRSELGR